MKLQPVLLIALGMAALLAPAWGQKSNNQSEYVPADKATSQFMMKAAQGGNAEVELGHLAEQKAASPEVKQFGERMVRDHTQAGEHLKRVAEITRLDLPKSLNAEDEALKVRLSGLSSREFDKAYMQAIVRDHQNDVAAFQKEAATADNSAVKMFASETLPTLQEHLRLAEKTLHDVENNTSASR